MLISRRKLFVGLGAIGAYIASKNAAMAAWIANGESGSSVRTKLNSLMVPISSVSISTPVEYVDIALPSGYDEYIIKATGIVIPSTETLSYAVSVDSGVTFIDSANAYTITITDWNSSALTQESYTDTLAYLNWWNTALLPLFSMTIFPGSVSQLPVIRSEAPFEIVNKGSMITSALAVAAGRVNSIRLCPYGDGDANPPTSGDTLTAGTFHLFGIPTP